MKSALSLTLIVCLVGSAMPMTAQEPTGSFDPGVHASPLTAGSPSRTATSAAVRLAAAGESAPSSVDPGPAAGASANVATSNIWRNSADLIVSEFLA